VGQRILAAFPFALIVYREFRAQSVVHPSVVASQTSSFYMVVSLNYKPSTWHLYDKITDSTLSHGVSHQTQHPQLGILRQKFTDAQYGGPARP
jgi:hypothetical protein